MNKSGVLQSIHRWDVWTFQRIMASRLHGILISSARHVSRTADGWLYPLFPVAMFSSGHEDAVALSCTFVLAFGFERALYYCAKNGFKRRRPPNVVPGYSSHIVPADEFSFPSGHTSAAFLTVTFMVMAFGPVFAALYLWAASVGTSRVILGVHFPTDTLIGAAMGTTIALLACGLSG